jgi:hypothetical protein
MTHRSRGAKLLGKRPRHGARPLRGIIAAKRSRWGIIVNQIFPDGMPKRSTRKGKGERRWRETRCSHPWCRSRTAEPSTSSPSGLVQFTIPKSISYGVSKCCLTPVSDANGSRPGPAASRPRRNIGCSLIISRSFAMAVHPLTQPMANAFAVPTTPSRQSKPGRRDQALGEGGKGFLSLARGRPATAPDLMRRFFSAAKTFDYFSRIQKFKRQTHNLLRQINGARPSRRRLAGFIFLKPRRGVKPAKKCREIPEGGYVMTAFAERAG